MKRFNRVNKPGVNPVSLVSTLRVLLVCGALSQYGTAFPIQQSGEPVSKTETRQEPDQSTVYASQGEAERARKVESHLKITIPNLEVVDQDGNKMHFYADLIRGKVVVINFIYTDCTYVCPMQGAGFSELQSALGDRIGKDVYLISVSTDPVTDTTERLKAWGEKFGARQGWKLVTGEKTQIDKLLLALSGDSARKGEHSAIAIIGSDDKGMWVRTYGLDRPRRMIEIIDSIINLPAAHAGRE